ncbi:MAG: YihY family inner membrane protein [Phycisphaerales bacterium]|jgi:membrane protein|nr:YihY family inner membrane protein [Phycisphaerales bacterium]
MIRKQIESVKRGVVGLLSSPGEELGRWGKFAKFQLQLWKFCAKRLRANNAAAMSTSLCFRTIFAMVPVIVLAALVMKATGQFEDYKTSLTQFLTTSGLSDIELAPQQADPPTPETNAATQPSEKTNLAKHIQKLIDSVEEKVTLGAVGPIGIVLLVWSAVTMLTTIERSLNRIFGARQSRPLVRRVMVYWTAVSLGPVLMTATAFAGSMMLEKIQGVSVLSWLLAFVGWAGPILVGILLLAGLYKLMPNTRVPTKAAIGGATIAVPLWLLAEWGFSLYVRDLVGKGSIYGTLGLIPLFLIWLNFSWLIFLFGAELAHTATNLSRMDLEEKAEKILLGPMELLGAALVVCRRFVVGQAPASAPDVAEALRLPDLSAHKLLDRLMESRLLCQTEQFGRQVYTLARPAETISVREIVELPLGVGEANSPSGDTVIGRAINAARRRTGNAFGEMSLAEVVVGGSDLVDTPEAT